MQIVTKETIKPTVVERIYKSVLKFLGPLSFEETYKRIVNEAVSLVDGEYGSLVLRSKGEFVKIYSSSPGDVSQPRKHAFTYKAFMEKTPLVVNTKDTVAAHPELKVLGIKTTLLIPLAYKNKSTGVLIVNTKREVQFSQEDLKVLQLFGSMASLAIRKSQLNQETENALKMRDMFISMASHELRTPLTTINGYVQLLHSRIRSDEVVGSWVNELSKEVNRLTLLVKELLEVNRIKSGHTQFMYRESNICEIVDRAVKTIKFGYPDRTVTLENKLGNDNVMVCDYDKLFQALSNILENAAKYSGSGKEIKMTLSKRNHQLRIVVKDRGIGIPPKDLPEIFNGYTQAKNHRREGLGLGLFLTKNIVDKHAGRINIKSRENYGTTVEVLLPQTQVTPSSYKH